MDIRNLRCLEYFIELIENDFKTIDNVGKSRPFIFIK